MADHIYEAALSKTTSTAAAPIAVIVPATLASGVRMPEIREIGVFNTSGVAAEIGIGSPAANGSTPTTSATVQAINELDPAGHTTLVTVHTTPATAPTVFNRRVPLQAVAGAGLIFTWAPGEYLLWAGATIPQVVIWQISTLAVTYDVYLKVAE
jgi:hypothetical protein